MGVLNRLRDAEIQNGNLADADDVAAELDQIINGHNDHDGRIDDIESNDVTLGGVKTFTSNPKTNGVDERSSNTGVTIDLTLIKKGSIGLDSKTVVASVDTSADTVTINQNHSLSTGELVEFTNSGGSLPGGISAGVAYYVRVTSASAFSLHPTSGDAGANTNKYDITSSGSGITYCHQDPPAASDGRIWYHKPSDTFKGLANGTKIPFLTAGAAWPKGYGQGRGVSWGSATTVVINAGNTWRDDSDNSNIDVTSDITIDITTATGAEVTNSLMNGLSEATSTWYYVWLISQANGASPRGLLTTSSSTIATMPTGYTLKKKLGAVYNDASGNFIEYESKLLPGKLEYRFLSSVGYYFSSATLGGLNVLNNGTATSPTSVDCSAYMPDNCEFVELHSYWNAGSAWQVSEAGSSARHNTFGTGSGVGQQGGIWCKTNGSQFVEYSRLGGAGGLYLDVTGFVMNL